MAIVELVKIMIMSVNIESLVEQGVNVKIEITAADLKMFGEVFPPGEDMKNGRTTCCSAPIFYLCIKDWG